MKLAKQVNQITQDARVETQPTASGMPLLRPIGGCLVAIATWAIVAVVLGTLAIPIDEAVLGGTFAASDNAGPCLTAAILGGMGAGALVYAFLLRQKRLGWAAIKAGLRKLAKRTRHTTRNSQG